MDIPFLHRLDLGTIPFFFQKEKQIKSNSPPPPEAHTSLRLASPVLKVDCRSHPHQRCHIDRHGSTTCEPSGVCSGGCDLGNFTKAELPLLHAAFTAGDGYCARHTEALLAFFFSLPARCAFERKRKIFQASSNSVPLSPPLIFCSRSALSTRPLQELLVCQFNTFVCYWHLEQQSTFKIVHRIGARYRPSLRHSGMAWLYVHCAYRRIFPPLRSPTHPPLCAQKMALAKKKKSACGQRSESWGGVGRC